MPRILVVRNDRLGDFMLAYPTLLLVKRSLPAAEIHALVPEYTREMAESCEGVDRVVLDPGPEVGPLALARRLRPERYDAIVALYSTARVGLAALAAGIPYRLAPATKVAQVFFNRRVTQRRSRSALPEHAYNLELGRRLVADLGGTPRPAEPPYLRFPDRLVRELEVRFRREHGIADGARLVFLHPGSGGSAASLSVEQFARLARGLRSPDPFTVVITAGPGEEAGAEAVAERLADRPHAIYRSREGLRHFARHVQFADLFVGGSTGPLHVAGALDRPTAAFYPRLRSSTALRWQTLNRAERRLAFAPPADAGENDMDRIDLAAAAEAISRAWLGA